MEALLNDTLASDLDELMQSERNALVRWESTIRTVRKLMLARRISDATDALQLEVRLLGEQRVRRENLRRRIGQHLRLPADAVCLSAIEPYLTTASRSSLSVHRTAIHELLRSIRTITNANAALLLQISNVMSHAIQSISRTYIPSTTYDAAGQLRVTSTNIARR